MNTGAELAAVLFDLDGTLVDTEQYWIAAEYALVEAHGRSWDETHAHALVGSALSVTGAYLRDHGVAMTPEEIVDSLLKSVIADCTRQTPWRPGALALLAELQAEAIACAMVTMSYTELAMTVADQLPRGTFQTLVTGDQVRHGKPHPEPYLAAAERLGVRAEHCVAIEDSPTGIASARAAGCVVVAVPNHVPIQPSAGLTILATLHGVTVRDLQALITAS